MTNPDKAFIRFVHLVKINIMKRLLIVLCFPLMLFSCEEVSEQSVTSPISSTQPSTPLELEKTGQVMAFSSFNTLVRSASEQNAKWTKSPLIVALHFTGSDMTSKNKKVTAESLSGGESFDKVLVSVEEDGLLDDSIRGTITILRLELIDSVWQISKATRLWKCWKDRGHETYSTEPCN